MNIKYYSTESYFLAYHFVIRKNKISEGKYVLVIKS